MHRAGVMKNKEGEEACVWTAWYNKAVFYGCAEKPSFNEKPDGVQVRVRKSDLDLLMGHTFMHEAAASLGFVQY